MEDLLTQSIKALQLRIDTDKANLEHDEKIQNFVRLLIDFPDAWSVIYHWRLHAKPLVVVEPSEFNFLRLQDDLLHIVSSSHYLRQYAYSFFEQYGALNFDTDRIKKVNYFLKNCGDNGLLERKDEFLLYCSQCHKVVLVNRLDNVREHCMCGMPYDFKFSLISIPSNISQEILSGHLLELYSLRVTKTIEGLNLIGMEVEGSKRKTVFTSIEYSGIGVGEKTNGELDLLGIKDKTLIAFECKLNETTLGDIKDFLGVSDNLFFKARDVEPNLKLRKVIITYDGSKLNPLNSYFVMSIKNLVSSSELVKEIKNLLH